MNNRKQAPSLAAPDPDTRWTPADAQRVLDEWAASGESLTAFAERHGLVAQRLSWWKRRLGVTSCTPARAPIAPLVPMTVLGGAHEEPPPARIEIGGVHVELRALDDTAAAFIAALARALGGAP